MTLNTRELEIFLARLYTNRQLYDDFVANPKSTMQRENLNVDVIEALGSIDIQGLKLAVKSYHHKRMHYQKKPLKFLSRIKRVFQL